MAPDVLRTLTAPAARPRRIALHLTLIVCSLLTFAYSLFLPAVQLAEDGGQDTAFPILGLNCLLMSVLYYPSNAFLLAAPLTSWRLRQRRTPAAQVVFALIGVTSLTLVARAPSLQHYANPMFEKAACTFDVGYYAWLAAHAMATAALLLPLWQQTPDERDALRKDFARLRKKWTPAAGRVG